MHGFYGRTLTVDLNQKTFGIEPVESQMLKTFLGGKGLATRLLLDHNPPNVDPLSPDNRLIFTTGPVSGSTVWGSCRYGVFTKSPLTGLYSESYSGGKTPEAIDSTGFDAIVITGRSSQPVVLAIDPTGVKFHDAEDVWGKDTFEAEDTVIERFSDSNSKFKKVGAVVIGPAAENLVRFSVIENDYWRSAGRTGAGAVMGSKRLKGLVFQGNQKRPIHDPRAIKKFSKEIAAASKNNPAATAYKRMGTPMMVKIVNQANAFPTRYWSKGYCDHWENISADALHERCRVTPKACLKCFMACGRMTTVLQGRHAGLKLEGPEYETIYAFGGLCLIDSIEEIVFLNDICDRLGMDTMTAGNLCALTIEAARRKTIDFSIDYGDVNAIAELLKKIADREDIGEVLSQGIIFAAKQWGLEDIAVHVKGLEPAGYDPRALKGMGLGYAVSDRGACHLRSTFYKPELSGMISPEQIKGKAELFLDFEDRLTIFDSLILCRFFRDMYPWEKLLTLVAVTTGMELTQAELRHMASRITDNTRRFNIREGLTAADDRLPKRLIKERLENGSLITHEEMETLVKDYYRLRGWTQEGIPPATGI